MARDGTARRRDANRCGRVRRARRRDRPACLPRTALQAPRGILLLTRLAGPGARRSRRRPRGRRAASVVAGQASIAQTPTQTTVTQSSQRAAIDWTSYDVGSGHTVIYQQPNASSITLNRVTGPDPSQIAGRIQANGQVAIVNGSGVVFSCRQPGRRAEPGRLLRQRQQRRTSWPARWCSTSRAARTRRISNAGTITVRADRPRGPGGAAGGQFRHHRRADGPCRAGRRRGPHRRPLWRRADERGRHAEVRRRRRPGRDGAGHQHRRDRRPMAARSC